MSASGANAAPSVTASVNAQISAARTSLDDALAARVRSFESSFGELGGCPVPAGATGNVASEDLVSMLHEMGYETGVDFEKALAAAQYEHSLLVGNYSGHQINITKRSVCCG